MLSDRLIIAGSGIRTHEAEARDLETRPFDRSGIPAETIRHDFQVKSLNYLELLGANQMKVLLEGLEPSTCSS